MSENDSDNSKITWHDEKRKLGELIPWPINPAQIKEPEAKRLLESLEEFGQVHALAISPTNEIYDGHQRQLVWGAAEKFGNDYEVDVRISSRELTEKERKKLVIYLRKGAAGEFDFDILANNWEVDDLLDWGFESYELGIIEPLDYSELDDELDELKGLVDTIIEIAVPEKYRDEILDWMADGEVKTQVGLGKGIMKRCGLL